MNSFRRLQRSRLGIAWESQSKTTSLALYAAHIHLSTMGTNYALYIGKSKTGTPASGCVKGIKDSNDLVHRNPHAFIFH
jgi:hypothetical protein